MAGIHAARLLAYSFVEVVAARHVMLIIRMVGGLMFLAGALIMIYNLMRTVMLPSSDSAHHPANATPASLALAAAE